MAKKVSLTVIGSADKPAGLILYHGPSVLTGEPIVSIATGIDGHSQNRKVGDGVIHVWYLDAKDHPYEAMQYGTDENVCGDCPARGSYCYVNLVTGGPGAIYNKWKRGGYRLARPKDLDLFRGRVVRLGAYGDPASCPIDIAQSIKAVSTATLAYTHQWETCDPAWREIAMASVETPLEAAQATEMGWRYFRVRRADEPLLPREAVCPASASRGYMKRCVDCLSCRGGSPPKASIVIDVHGSPPKKAMYRKVRTGN